MLNNPNTKPIRIINTRKLPARYTAIVFAFFMSAIMAFLMCLVITAASNNFTSDYLLKVLHAYTLAMPVAFVCILIVRPMVIKLVGLCVRG